jgi:hypothetical protein
MKCEIKHDHMFTRWVVDFFNEFRPDRIVMAFEVLGFSTTTSIIFLIGICGLGLAVLVLIYVLVQWLCCDRDASSGELDSVTGKSGSGGTEALIPPLFYTHQIPDPLMQPDLRDDSLLQPNARDPALTAALI